MKGRIQVTLKPDVLDPQGKAIQQAATALGYATLRGVRQGKLFEVELEAADEESARELLGELCKKLLANPVIEDFEILGVD